MWADRSIGKVLKALASLEGDIPVILIRRGDIADTTAHDDDQHSYHIMATTMAILYAYLRNTRTALDRDAPYRYTRHPAGTRDTWGGYNADDWFRAVIHLHFFNKRRIASNRSALDMEGPKANAKLPALYVLAKVVVDGQLDEDQHQSSEVNVNGVANMTLHSLTFNRMASMTTRDLVKEHGYEVVFNNTNKRLRIMIAGSELAAVRKNQRANFRATADDSEADPVSIISLDALIKSLWREKLFLEPEVSGPSEDLIQNFAHLLPKGFEHDLKQYIASQSNMTDTLAQMMEEDGDFQEDESGALVKVTRT